MFYFLCKTLLNTRNGYRLKAQNPSMVVLSSLRYLSCDANRPSFTVSYLINICGLTPESALSASKVVKFETSQKPDLILSFFQKHGFSKTQISKMITKFPKILSLYPEKYIFPKVEFFRSKGASTADLIRIFTLCPRILERSLENHLIPSFNFYREFLQSDEKAIAAIKQFPSILSRRVEANVMPNINTLRENGVPATNIFFLVRFNTRKLGTNSDKFGNIVEEVKEMGFDPLKSQFVAAVTVLIGCTKLTRDKKVDAYKRWGWSDKDIIAAFRKNPCCMTISEDKIMTTMDFYVSKLGLDPSVIANRPLLLCLSLKKRLIPRAAVMQFLTSKGLFKFDSSKTRLFECTEKWFLEKFVNCHEDASHLLKLYNEKLHLLKQQGNQQPGKINL